MAGKAQQRTVGDVIVAVMIVMMMMMALFAVAMFHEKRRTRQGKREII